jgi:predicted dehydrogenase
MASRSLRFVPSAMAIKQSLAAEQLGIPGLVRIHCWQPHVETEENNALKRIAHFSSSAIDLAIWLFQAIPISVYSVTGMPKGQAFDYVQLHLGFPDGGMALMDISNTLPAGDAYLSMSLIGSQGAAYADDHHNKQLLFRGREPAALHTAEGVEDRLLAELQEFVDAISEQREPTVRGDDARAVLTVCQAAVQSIEAGRAVQLEAGETP